MKTAIKSRYIASFHDREPFFLENGTILIDGNMITKIGHNLDTSGYEVVELPHHIIIPGLINAHSHAAMTLFRGFADDVPLNSWLNDYIWPLEGKLKRENVNSGAKLAALEMIQSGSTTINSMYWHPDAEIEAFNELGVRLLSGPPIISNLNSLKSYEYLVDKWHSTNNDLIRITLNPHAPYTVTADDWIDIYEYKQNYNNTTSGPPLKIHTHLDEADTEFDLLKQFAKSNDFEINASDKTTTQYLNRLGILDNDLIAAHAVNCNLEDIGLLSSKGVGISINTVSNMKLGNNFAKVHKMIKNNTKVALGTDGPASNNSLNMIETMKFTALTQKSIHKDPTTINAEKILQLATYGGARVLGWDNLGAIKEGYLADLIAFDLSQPHLRPITSPNSIFSLLVYSAQPSDISDVMINGKWRKSQNSVLADVEGIMEDFDENVQNLLNQA